LVHKVQKNYSVVDADIVMDHIILAATALDLETCRIGVFDVLAAKEVLSLDNTYHRAGDIYAFGISPRGCSQ
jgi:nitroreductase